MNKKIFFFREKKGEQENLSFMWIFLFVVVTFVIGVSVSIVYSQNIEIGEVENKILLDRIYSCLIDKGVLNEEVFKEDFNIYSFCSLDKDIFEKKGIYYFNLGFYNISGDVLDNVNENPIKKGDFSFEKECQIISSDIKVSNGIACLSGKKNFLFYKDNKLNKGYFNFLIASNNKGGNIQIS